VPIEDEGWGDAVPVSGPAKPGSGGGGPGSRMWLWIVVGSAVLVAGIAGAAIALTSGGSKSAGAAASTTTTTTTTRSTTTTTTTTTRATGLTKAAFIRKADAICTGFATPLQLAGGTSNVAKFISLFKKELAELEQLTPPSEGFETWLSAEIWARKGLTAIEQGDATTAGTDTTEADVFAQQYGLRVCDHTI
jgi:hypothetical protein